MTPPTHSPLILYTFGPAFGLTDPSPFVIKMETLLRMGGVPYTTRSANLLKAPKKKAPYIEENGQLLGDSTFIRWHLEQTRGIDFDKGLNAEQRAIAWAFEKMVEDNLYWAMVDMRWMDDSNFDRGPKSFFNGAPAPLRPLIAFIVRRKVRRNLDGHGMGRHSQDEIAQLAAHTLQAMADLIGDKPYFMGDEPTGLDATMFAFASTAMAPLFVSPIPRAAATHANLRSFIGRMAGRFYPEFAEIAGCPTIR